MKVGGRERRGRGVAGVPQEGERLKEKEVQIEEET